MKNTFFYLLVVLLLATACKRDEIDDIQVIPRPETYYVSRDMVTLDADTRIIYEDPNPALRLMGEDLSAFIASKSTFAPKVLPYSEVKSLENDIFLATNLADSTFGNEGYRIRRMDGQMFVIQANSPRGVFYAIQSLKQLFPLGFFQNQDKQDEWELPATTINDKPRFAYRGMHLDVGRHFFPVSFVKQYIDLLAMYKYNYMHWHLTEDQGWRIEIKAFPKLTEVGAWRKETIVGHQSARPKVFDGKPYGGFYTKDEVREIVDYAASKYITIIPEIEMPGHSLAALAAYPELGCNKGPYEVATQWGVFDDIYCTREATFQFLEQVLTEVMELFPGQYIHIGGDEAPKARWKRCKDCQQRMREEGLADESALQSYFITRMGQFLSDHNRKLIGWDEILEGGLAPDATVMSWRGTEGGIAAAKMQHDVIMTPGSHCYFDHYQADPQTQPLAIGGLTRLSKVYAFEPVPEELNAAQAKHVIGAQANVWTEYLSAPADVTYMVLPRMAAMAEVVWSPMDKRSWEKFYDRLPLHFARYEAMGLRYCKAVNEVGVRTSEQTGKRLLELSTEVPGAEIHYTLDGTNPGIESALYDTAVDLGDATVVKVQLFRNGKALGGIQIRKPPTSNF